jgi:hypothetical protein
MAMKTRTTRRSTRPTIKSHAGLARALVEHLAVSPLQGVAAVLRRHSMVKPFPDPVTTGMDLLEDFSLTDSGKEAMTPDLSVLRQSLGHSGLVSPAKVIAAQTVGDLVGLV